MLGNAMRRDPGEKFGEKPGRSGDHDAIADESAGCLREKSDCAEKHRQPEGDEHVAEAADEAKLFVVGRGGQFRRLANIFQRTEALEPVRQL